MLILSRARKICMPHAAAGKDRGADASAARLVALCRGASLGMLSALEEITRLLILEGQLDGSVLRCLWRTCLQYAMQLPNTQGGCPEDS